LYQQRNEINYMGTLHFGFVLGLVAWFRVRHPAALIPRNSELLGQLVAATQSPMAGAK